MSSEPLPQLLDCMGVQRELGVKRTAAEAIMGQLPVFQPPGVQKVYVRAADVLRYVEEHFGMERQELGELLSGSSHIRVRAVSGGEKRYIVRYRRGGRGTKLVHAGAKKTLKEARILKQTVDGELAAGRDPMLLLRPVASAPAHRTLGEWSTAWFATRHDLDETSRKLYGAALKAFVRLAGRDVTSLQPSDFQEWITEMTQPAAEGEKPRLGAGTARVYLNVICQVLDFAEVSPNPGRSRKNRLPKQEREEVSPPPAQHVREILARVKPSFVLPLVLLEQCALRVNEPSTLEWRDVDVAGSKLRLRARETKAARARWVEVPGWLMAEISSTCPPEDRDSERRVFPEFTGMRAWHAMKSACQAAGIPHYHPHDLRHRRASLWHMGGMPVKELQERGGWSRATIPLEVYSHVMPIEELTPATLRGLLTRTP